LVDEELRIGVARVVDFAGLIDDVEIADAVD
jgi:hypothetical protein